MPPTKGQFDRMDQEAAREKRIQDAIVELRAALQPHDDNVLWHLQNVLGFKPEVTPIQFTSIASSTYGGMTMTAKHRRDVLKELHDDARAPFFSESFLYNLLGKEDARTLRARMRGFLKALGFTDEQTREWL